MDFKHKTVEPEIIPIERTKPKDQPVFATGSASTQWPCYISNGAVFFKDGEIEFQMKYNKMYVITKHLPPKNLEENKKQIASKVPVMQSKIYDGNGNKLNIVLNLAAMMICHDENDVSSMENCNVCEAREGDVVIYEICLCLEHRKFITDQGVELPTKTDLVAKDPHTRKMSQCELQKLMKDMEREMRIHEKEMNPSASTSSVGKDKTKKKATREVSEWDNVE